MININGKEYRNIQEQVEKNKDDIEDLQDNTASKQYVDNSINDVYGNVYTRDQADDRFPTETHMNLLLGYKQDKLTAGANITIDSDNVISATGGSGEEYTAGDNIVIDSSNEISVSPNPIFNNVSIDNDNYYANTYQGTVIEYNESGDNDSGWIKMTGNNPELYAYNDHLHGEYGNDSKLQMLEDIKVTKTGYDNYPDGYYSKTYDLIDTLESHANSINNISSNYVTTDTAQTITGQKTYTESYLVINNKKVSFYDGTVESYTRKVELNPNVLTFTSTSNDKFRVKVANTINNATVTQNYYFPLPDGGSSRTIAMEDAVPGYGTLPDTTTDGTYVLEATVYNGTITYNWVLKQ